MGNDPSSSAMMGNNGIQMASQGGNIIATINGNGVIADPTKELKGTSQEGNAKSGNSKRAIGKNRLKELEGLRASQSFDDSVLLVDSESANIPGSNSANNKLSPTNLLQQNHPHFPGDLAASPITSSRTGGVGRVRGGPRSSSRLSHNLVMWNNQLGSNEDLFINKPNNDNSHPNTNVLELENNPIYEPPPNSNKQANIKDGDKQNSNGASGKSTEISANGATNQVDITVGTKNSGEGGTPSESDETAYGGQSSSIYSRAPSQCSSVSATQSFDMRMYGRSKIMQVSFILFLLAVTINEKFSHNVIF